MITIEEAALIGYESERRKIVARILELELQLKRYRRTAVLPRGGTPPKRSTRRMSAAARKRIAEAQKKRVAARADESEGPSSLDELSCEVLQKALLARAKARTAISKGSAAR